MRWRLGLIARALIAAGLLVAPVVHARPNSTDGSPDGRQTAAPARRPLDVFTPLVGHDWIAEFNNGQLTDSSRFEFVYDAQFVRNTHVVRTLEGQQVYEGETLYAWDARAQRIVWWYWNASGGYVEGTVTVVDDHTMLVEGANHGPASQLDRVRVRIGITATGWTSAGASEKGGVWTDDPPRTYRIARPKTAAR